MVPGEMGSQFGWYVCFLAGRLSQVVDEYCRAVNHPPPAVTRLQGVVLALEQADVIAQTA